MAILHGRCRFNLRCWIVTKIQVKYSLSNIVMAYDQLLHFVEKWMSRRIQHNYLPLLIGQPVDSGGSATLWQLAQSIPMGILGINC